MEKQQFLSALIEQHEGRAIFMKSTFYKLICLPLAITLILSFAGCSQQTGSQKQDKVIKSLSVINLL